MYLLQQNDTNIIHMFASLIPEVWAHLNTLGGGQSSSWRKLVKTIYSGNPVPHTFRVDEIWQESWEWTANTVKVKLQAEELTVNTEPALNR